MKSLAPSSYRIRRTTSRGRLHLLKPHPQNYSNAHKERAWEFSVESPKISSGGIQRLLMSRWTKTSRTRGRSGCRQCSTEKAERSWWTTLGGKSLIVVSVALLAILACKEEEQIVPMGHQLPVRINTCLEYCEAFPSKCTAFDWRRARSAGPNCRIYKPGRRW